MSTKKYKILKDEYCGRQKDYATKNLWPKIGESSFDQGFC